MDDDTLGKLLTAETVRQYVEILGVEMYAINADEDDLSLDAFKTLNVEELTRQLGFSKDDARKIVVSFKKLLTQEMKIFHPFGILRNPNLQVNKVRRVAFTLEDEVKTFEKPYVVSLTEKILTIPPVDKARFNLGFSSTILTAAALNDTNCIRKIMCQYPGQTTEALNRKNRRGWTPLLLAVQRGHLEAVRYLIHYGANLDDCNKKGRTALMLAASWGHIRVLDLLLHKLVSYGPLYLEKHFDTVDCDGKTVLHLAISANQIQCITILGKYRNLSAYIQTTRNGKSALLMAEEMNREEVCEILQPRREVIRSNGYSYTRSA